MYLSDPSPYDRVRLREVKKWQQLVDEIPKIILLEHSRIQVIHYLVAMKIHKTPIMIFHIISSKQVMCINLHVILLVCISQNMQQYGFLCKVQQGP